MAVDRHIQEQILRNVPQQPPFRFIDEIIEIDDEHIVGAYRFREDEYFYKGHFPGRPITPGVILLEAMAQTGVVAFGLYLTMKKKTFSTDSSNEFVTLFTFADGVEFTGIVSPGERVIIEGTKVYFKMGNLKAHVRMFRENGEQVSSGTLAGMAIKSSS